MARQPNQRKNRRQPLHYQAWIVLEPDQPPHKCMLSDVSKSGAKIKLDDGLEPPPEFVLLLAAGGSRRKCRIAWRDGTDLGIEFL